MNCKLTIRPHLVTVTDCDGNKINEASAYVNDTISINEVVNNVRCYMSADEWQNIEIEVLYTNQVYYIFRTWKNGDIQKSPIKAVYEPNLKEEEDNTPSWVELHMYNDYEDCKKAYDEI